jgi:hypothetical protein
MSKDLIELTTTEDGKEKKYVGRFLGFIKDDEFNALVQNVEDVAARLESKATQPLLKVAAKFDEINGYRLIMAVKRVNNETVIKKMLYVSEGLTLIDSVVPAVSVKTWNNKTQEYDEPRPGKVTFQAGENDNITVQETE